jgi:ADP-ribosyl-[dinitrogen reductase] hydrolase
LDGAHLEDAGSTPAPLRIDAVPVGEAGGLLGMTLCPGQPPWDPIAGSAARDLEADLLSIRNWGAGILVSLMEAAEMRDLGVQTIPALARRLGLAHLHLPIVDMHVPERDFELAWRDAGPRVHGELRRGGRVALDCYAGLGRTGTVAARILVETGVAPDEAIRRVRAARPSTIQTRLQELHVHTFRG